MAKALPLTAAYCWRTGIIEFGLSVPEGALPIAFGRGDAFRTKVAVCARLAYDNETLLVPGVPEASDDDAAVDAVLRFQRWVTAPPGQKWGSSQQATA